MGNTGIFKPTYVVVPRLEKTGVKVVCMLLLFCKFLFLWKKLGLEQGSPIPGLQPTTKLHE